MRGRLQFINNQWVVGYSSFNENRINLPISEKSLGDYILQENDNVRYIVLPITNEAEIVEYFDYNQPTVSDDFQIGPDGAYEHNEEDIRASQRLLDDSDYMAGYKRSEPIEEKHYSIKFETDWRFFTITPAFNLNFHGGFRFEIEWLFFGLYFSISNSPLTPYPLTKYKIKL
jgi:hypothetical protein